jgi:hypothetical protein
MMIEAMLAALQLRWEQYGTWVWDSHDAHAELIAWPLPKHRRGHDGLLPKCSPERKTADQRRSLISRLTSQNMLVGDTGIEPVTPTVSR